MTTIKIKILDSIHCRASNEESTDLLRPVLSYEEVITRIGPRGPIHKSKRVNLISTKGLFPTGALGTILNHFENKTTDIKLEGNLPKLQYYDVPAQLSGITYRPYQKDAICTGIAWQRGVIQAPARAGKTVIAAGIISSLATKQHVRAIFLTNTKDIFWQTETAFKEFGFDVGLIGDGKKEIGHDVTIALYQSLTKLAKPDFLSRFNVIIVDECHHARKKNGSYWKILMNSPAPVKLGLTATVPKKAGERLIMECLIGPVIYETSHEEAEEIGATVKAKIKILRAPEIALHIKTKSYQDAYQEGIVDNRALNRVIIKEASRLVETGDSVLVLVSRVQHGFNLEKMFNLLYPHYEVPFLCGGIDKSTKEYLKFLKKKLIRMEGFTKRPVKEIKRADSEICRIKELERDVREKSKKREQYRQKFINKEIPCIVATNVWNEGVNIPTLNAIINAGGGKEEIPTIQASSRSLTASEGKTQGLIVDIFNPLHKSFIEHFGHRICIYSDLGWL